MAIGSLANFVKSKLNETNLSETFGTADKKISDENLNTYYFRFILTRII